MTNALIERIARLLNDTYRERFDGRSERLGLDRPPALLWEELSPQRQADYCAAARAAIKALGR